MAVIVPASMRKNDLERLACIPATLNPGGFNSNAQLPYGLTPNHIRPAMEDFLDFLGLINLALAKKKIPRLESFLMPANFSSMVGEFMSISIPKRCQTLMKNIYHNGHPDLVPIGCYEKNSCLHGDQGIEIKASRHPSGWQGHNVEDVWLMVFVFQSNTPRDQAAKAPPMPFRFLKVVGARISKEDWKFSGRSETSRRTITASVVQSGFAKMEANWIYRSDASGERE